MKFFGLFVNRRVERAKRENEALFLAELRDEREERYLIRINALLPNGFLLRFTSHQYADFWARNKTALYIEAIDGATFTLPFSNDVTEENFEERFKAEIVSRLVLAP